MQNVYVLSNIYDFIYQKIVKIERKTMTLDDLFSGFIDSLILYNSEGYVSYSKKEQATIKKYFGNCDISQINYKTCTEFMLHLKNDGYSANTINKHISHIKRLFKFNDINSDIFKIRKIKEKFITFGTCEDDPEEVINKILPSLSLQNKLIIVLLYDTGVRLNELLNIEYENVDWDNRTILLTTTKTGRERYVFFTKEFKKLATTFRKKHNSKWLFYNPKNCDKLKKSAIESLFARIRKKLGIRNFSPHRLRHSLSTEMYSNGCDLIQICSILGHSNVNTTKRYIHPDLEKERANYDEFHKKKK